MGSGHFLVGAVDRIESRLYAYLTENPLSPVEDELDNLEDAALEAFEDEEYAPPVERGQLLRRQVARRCIYGVDINPLSTELARLSIWVHTFVPGLPLTFLDYNLVTGDSLAGIGTLDEVTGILDLEQSSLGMFAGGRSVMKEIRGDIDRLGNFADASAEQVQEARKTRTEIEKKIEQVRARFDVLAASRVDEDIDTDPVSDTDIDITQEDCYEKAQQVLKSTDPLHFPAAFPEVFDGEDSGFDVIVGNPPWEEELIDKDNFWRRYNPGIKGRPKGEKQQRIQDLEQERPDLAKAYKKEREKKQTRRKILTSGPYPGMGTGDPDTYKAFCWRFWGLVNSHGRVGVVLPRSAFLSAGTEQFRTTIIDDGKINDLTFLKNKRGWVFDQAEHRYTIALVAFSRSSKGGHPVPLRGPFPNADSYERGMRSEAHQFPASDAKNWTDSAAFPLLPEDPRSVKVFNKLTTAPRLDYNESDSWRARPNTELHATNDKETDDGETLMHFDDDPPSPHWPIYKGSSFDIWEPDTGVRYAWADPHVIRDYLQESRENSFRYAGSRSAFSEFSETWVRNEETLPCLRTRIAFRNVTNRTNQRTIICSAVPPKTVLTNAAPYFLFPRGKERDQAFLLGVLSSIPLDWYARRFVESNVNYHILNAFPVPRPEADNQYYKRVVEIAGRLSAVDDRFQRWAESLNVAYGPIENDKKEQLIQELDAVVSHLYNLSEEDIRTIFETFHTGWDYHDRLDGVIEQYRSWE
jgi:hypothetical protein